MKPVRLIATLLGLLLVTGFAAAAEEPKAAPTANDKLSPECVSPEAYKALETCPGGPSKFEVHQKRAAAFKSAPPPRTMTAKKDDLGKKGGDVDATATRDTRKGRLQARARQLLITEITGLERLNSRTRKKSPDRPQLVRRLAEGYVELGAAADRDKIQAEIKADDAKKNRKKSEFDKARADASSAKKIVQTARQNAIKFYTIMKNDYPNYSKIDEILYYLAYEHEQAGQLDDARKVYYELIQRAPKSKYIPNAYLAFGELFFQEAMGDPEKWALAAEAYKQVAKYPPPENKVYGYSLYKLAYVYWNTNDYPKAIEQFREVILYAQKFASLPGASQLDKAARRDMIPVYAVAGKPDKAYNFFKPLSGDPGGEQTKTIAMMNELGLAYLDTGHYPEAVALYRDLESRDPGDRTCEYQTHITEAIQAWKSGDKPMIVKELNTQLALRNDFIKDKHPDKNKLACSNSTAELLAETGMSWHLEAVGSGGVRGTNDKNTMDQAAYLYKKVTENFTNEDFAKFEFPRIVKDDWPTLRKIRYAMADLLFFQQRWEECGPAFDAVVADDPKGAQAAEAAYASVLCYQKMYDATHQGDADRKGRGLGPKGSSKEDREAKKGEAEKFKPKDFTEQQKGMIQAFNRYICYINPPKGDKEAEEQYVEVKYARARTYFEAQHWEEAAIAFRDVALHHSDKDAALYAANLYLEALNVLGGRTDPPRPACFDDMGNDVPVYISLFCQGAKAEENKEACDLLTRIECDIKRLKAEKTIELADSGKSQDTIQTYKDGGDAYIAVWREYGEAQAEAGKASTCGRMEEVLYNAAKAYQAGRLLAKAIGVRKLLLDPRYKLNETELAQKAIYEIGGNYQAIAVYDQAAFFFEMYAQRTKFKGETADQAMSDAVVLRLGLGQDDEAIDDAKNFNKYFGARKPEQAAQITFAIAAHYGEKGEWETVRKQLTGGPMGVIDKQATTDVKVQAHALLGRALRNLRSGAAAGEYGKVIGVWKDPAKAVATITGDEAGKARRIGRALEAVGESLFYMADKEREKVLAVQFPEYKGKGTVEEVKKHIQVKVKAWIEKKRPLIEKATVEYKKIVDLQPLPPPRWVIAAGARVGDMWAQFVKEFRAAPIPDFMKKDAELRNAYYGSLDEASEPQKLTAKGAFQTCLEYSVKYQYFDEYSRSCEVWLSQNYKNEFHLIDEFRGAPNRVNSALDERPYPLQVNGEPFVTATEEAAPKPKAKEEDGDDKDDKDKGDKKKKGSK